MQILNLPIELGCSDGLIVLSNDAQNNCLSAKDKATALHKILTGKLTALVLAEFLKLFEVENPDESGWLDPQYIEGDYYSKISLRINGEMTDNNITKTSLLLGYAFMSTVCNPEGLDYPKIVYNNSLDGCRLDYFYDSSKSPRSDCHLMDALQMFHEIQKDGSLIRTRGPEKGTRKFEGLGFELNYIILVK